MLELVFYLGLAAGLVGGLFAGLLIAPRERNVRLAINAAELAREINRQGGFKLTVQTDCDALASAIVDAERRAEKQDALH